MEQRWICGDFMTGDYICDLPVLGESSWASALNDVGRVEVQVSAADPKVRRLGLDKLLVPWRTYIGVVYDDVIMQAGPVTTSFYDHDTGRYQISAVGAAGYFARRRVLPVSAATEPLYDYPNKRPNPGVAQALNGSYRNIVNSMLTTLMAWPGGAPSLTFRPSDPGGTYTRTYLGTELKEFWEAITDITDVENGIDVMVRPQWVDTAQVKVRWMVDTGTLAKPLLAGGPVVWDTTRPNVNLSKLKVTSDGTNITTRVWVTGGRDSDQPLYATAQNTELINAGMPLLETVDSLHTSVSDQATLNAWAADHLAAHARPVVTCDFEVRGDGNPKVTDWQVGDWVELITDGIPHLDDGVNQMRILGRTGSASDMQIGVTVAPVRGQDAWLSEDQ
ncbi:hypothetical protein ACQCX2_17530 [Propionibacteriaceae bacterium Y1700]|uniref:hypothetical protein n=1 Tax=Microlunatus sp. Y1700 TaxID=3418487 RepID=UPI003DA6CFD0